MGCGRTGKPDKLCFGRTRLALPLGWSQSLVTEASFRHLALAMPEATEGSHMGHADFRVGKRIFATLGYPDDGWAMVKLTPDQQQVMVAAARDVCVPAKGAWGKRGATLLRLARVDKSKAAEAIGMAWRNLVS
jgi:hypothetical protein